MARGAGGPRHEAAAVHRGDRKCRGGVALCRKFANAGLSNRLSRRPGASAKSQDVGGLATMASPFFNFNRKRLTALAAQDRLPSIWEAGAFVHDGGLLAYGPSFPDMYRRSAGYVARILRGAKASELPIEQPVRFELVVNIKTAKSLGITVPATLLARADEIIE
jgi:putative ABC transport system substrate-binding protein